jgi:hypothetical protein
MNWIDLAISDLSSEIPCGYLRQGSAHSEPTALAAIGLMARDPQRYRTQINVARTWLAKQQLPNGSVRLNAQSAEIAWTTPLALLAEATAKRIDIIQDAASSSLLIDVPKAINWLTTVHGNTAQKDTNVAHNVEIPGWSWIAGTHTWLEPTCMAVLALKANGLANHKRTREGVNVIRDRLLPHGGCNYGNTIVLGQELLPHIQPTGIALMALAGEQDTNGRIAKSIAWLRSSIDEETAAASLSYATLGLIAYDAVPNDAMNWLEKSYERAVKHGKSPLRLALLSWAGCQLESGEKSSWPGMNAKKESVQS